jgi:DNA-binding NarL/FixJ family response regulator
MTKPTPDLLLQLILAAAVDGVCSIDTDDARALAGYVAGRLSERAAMTALPAGISRLTPREAEIVEMLLAGDRVPHIASTLYLSQATVRNHLSSVFHKVRVSSQQELIALLRGLQAEDRLAGLSVPSLLRPAVNGQAVRHG